jgi:hypothetical protein
VTDAGSWNARWLTHFPNSTTIDANSSSAYLRVRHSVQPLAASLGTPFRTDLDSTHVCLWTALQLTGGTWFGVLFLTMTREGPEAIRRDKCCILRGRA